MTAVKLLDKLEIKNGEYRELREYLKYSLGYIKKNSIDPLDINLESDIYPYVAEKLGLARTTTKSKFIRALVKFNNENPDVIEEYFGIKYKKMTLKKLLILLSIELKK